MMERIAEASPRFKARVAGVFEMLEGMTSAFGQVFVLGRLIVSGPLSSGLRAISLGRFSSTTCLGL